MIAPIYYTFISLPTWFCMNGFALLCTSLGFTGAGAVNFPWHWIIEEYCECLSCETASNFARVDSWLYPEDTLQFQTVRAVCRDEPGTIYPRSDTRAVKTAGRSAPLNRSLGAGSQSPLGIGAGSSNWRQTLEILPGSSSGIFGDVRLFVASVHCEAANPIIRELLRNGVLKIGCVNYDPRSGRDCRFEIWWQRKQGGDHGYSIC